MQQLLDLIKQKESYGGNYNVFKGSRKEHNLTDMTVNEVRAMQKKQMGNKAAGAYQIIPATFDYLMGKMKLSGNEKFTPEMQDRMAVQLLERRGLSKFQAGKMSIEDFGNEVAKEWASFPLLKEIKDKRGVKKVGTSYYQGDKYGNRALFNEPQVESYRNILFNVQNPDALPTTMPEITTTGPDPYTLPVAPPAPTEGESTNRYTVQSGDTLGRIAREYNVSVDQLANMNNIADPDKIAVGQRLAVPSANLSTMYNQFANFANDLLINPLMGR